MLQAKQPKKFGFASCHELEEPPETKPPASWPGLRRILLILAGAVSVGFGVLGAALPVLPTTPFLLLAAACFARSSHRLHRWLLCNRFFGDHLRRYRAGEGLPRAHKISTLALLWASLAVSAFIAVPARLWWVRLLLLGVGVGVTAHILRIKTQKRG